MADGDYERGRGREIAAIAAHLKRLASARAASRPPRMPEPGGQAVLRPPRMPEPGGQAVLRPPRVPEPGGQVVLRPPRVLILNGWAAAPRAWDLCRFAHRPGCEILSYLDQLDGIPARRLAAGRDRCLLVGWSMGGSSALRLACQYPDRLAGLVLVAATPRMMAAEGWPGMSPRRLDALRRGLELTHGEGFFGVPEGKPNPYQTDTPENLARGLNDLLETDVRDELRRVPPCHFPVFIFQSARDGIVRPENADFLRTIFPQARVTVVPGAEHALPIYIPQEIDDAVDACLAVAP